MFERYGIKQRFVDESDAEFILSLRLDAKLSRFLSKTENSLQKQIDWIKMYKEREARGEEYYFITLDENGKRFGVNRLYNFDEESFEVGSWLFLNEAKSSVSILSDITTREYGFNLKSHKFCRFEVRKENLSVLAYHKRFNPILVNEDDLNNYYILPKENFNEYKNKLLKVYGYGIK